MRKPKPVQSTSEISDAFAENCRVVFESFLKKGFTSEQAFQLLLLVLKTQT